jgi:RNA polymerase sigma-70 factor (ECF subfamily)
MRSTLEAVMSPELPFSHQALVVQARDGDRDAREELADWAGREAYVFALQLTRSSETARDVAQDALLRFFQNIDRYDANQPVRPWLFAIVRNQARDAARRDKVRSHGSLDAWLEQGMPEPASSDDPVATAERHEMQRRVWQAISDLGETQREILVLRDYHGLAYREIAAVLAIPPGTVMSRLHAARGRLRATLIARASGEGADDTDPERA